MYGVIFSIIKGPLKLNLLPNIKDFSSFLKICVQFQVFKNLFFLKKQINMIKFEKNWKKIKNKNLFRIKKVLAPIPIPKLDLGFSSWYQNPLFHFGSNLQRRMSIHSPEYYPPKEKMLRGVILSPILGDLSQQKIFWD